MGDIQEQTLRELFEQEVAKKFVCARPEQSTACTSCAFQKMCRGGCKRMKDAMYGDRQGFCGYQQVLKEFIPQLQKILTLVEEVRV